MASQEKRRIPSELILRIYEAIPPDPDTISFTELSKKTNCRNPFGALKANDPIYENDKGRIAFINRKTKENFLSYLKSVREAANA